MGDEGNVSTYWNVYRKMNKLGPDKYSPDIIHDTGGKLRTTEGKGLGLLRIYLEQTDKVKGILESMLENNI